LSKDVCLSIFPFQPSLSGMCETLYKLKHEVSEDSQPSMKIEKIRDLDKCMERVVHLRGLLAGKQCEADKKGQVSLY